MQGWARDKIRKQQWCDWGVTRPGGTRTQVWSSAPTWKAKQESMHLENPIALKAETGRFLEPAGQTASPRCQWGTVPRKTSCTHPSWGMISDGGFQPTHTHTRTWTQTCALTHVCQMTEDMEGGMLSDTTLSEVTSLTQVRWCLSTDVEWNTQPLDEEHSQDKCKCPEPASSFREWSGGQHEYSGKNEGQAKDTELWRPPPQMGWKCTRETCSTPFRFYSVHILFMSGNVGIYILQYTCKGQRTTLWGLGSNLSQPSCA